MSRIRITLSTALVILLAAAVITSQAQPPAGGRGGGGGGRGNRGGGPGGPGGFGGGPAGNLITLAGNEVVAKELKLTDRQKTKVKQIADEQNTKRGEVTNQMRQQIQRASNQMAQQAQAGAMQQPQIDPSVNARGSGAGNALAGALNSRGYQGPMYGGRVQGQGVDPALQQQAARFQGRQAANAVQAQGFMMMREAMQQLQNQFEGELAKTLDKAQIKRLKEIQLQVQGPSAVLREDVVARLELTEDQVGEIQQVLNEANQTQRELMRTNFQFMRSMMPNQPAAGNTAAPGAQADPNAAATPAAGQTGQGQGGQGQAQGGRGGRGGRGGAGGGGANGQNNRGGFNREAMQKVMEQPEVKAKMEETRKQQSQLRDKEYALVFRAMDRRQVAVFKKLLGKPFDVDSIMNGGFFRGGPGGPGGPGGRRNGANGTANPTAPAATANTAKATTPAASDDTSGDSAATAKPAATPRRQSLRERRGLGGQQPTPDGDSPQ